MEISPELRKFILDYSNEVDNYQFEKIYSALKANDLEFHVGTFTEMMLSIEIDPAKYLGYIPDSYLLGSRLKSYKIPNNVTSIGSSAFEYCSGLMSITIPDSVRSIGDFAFQNCNGLKSVSIGNGVTSIGKYAFYGCSELTSVTIGSGVASIGEEAFRYCSLEEVSYTGTTEQWKRVKIGKRVFLSASQIIHCTDGDVEV